MLASSLLPEPYTVAVRTSGDPRVDLRSVIIASDHSLARTLLNTHRLTTLFWCRQSSCETIYDCVDRFTVRRRAPRGHSASETRMYPGIANPRMRVHNGRGSLLFDCGSQQNRELSRLGTFFECSPNTSTQPCCVHVGTAGLNFQVLLTSWDFDQTDDTHIEQSTLADFLKSFMFSRRCRLVKMPSI